ncbi:MAG: class A beta-lactamase-related serine hydrolase [Bacteroidetes bacterium CHB5]|nr:class A beta-lactamase-related serine hydrolase [Bacteroidetes bacterium CHB5]
MKSLIVASLLLLISSVQAQTLISAKPEQAGMSAERLQRVDQMVNGFLLQGQIPGAVVLIARQGKIVYHKAYGYSNLENKTPLKPNDIFRIASQSKAITSLAAMMCFEEGKFLLDEPVSKYIPEFKNPRVLVNFNEKDSSYFTEPAKSEPTIRQLLTHTSGIDYAGIGSKELRAIFAKAGVPSGIGNHQGFLADKMKILAKLPLKHHPGERYTYGLNTDVLGYLVEIWSGMSLDQFFKTRIFSPLGMNDTYFYLPAEKHNRLVTLYETRDGKLAQPSGKIYDGVTPQYPTLAGTYYSGGAGLSSTVEDYAKFLQLFLNNGVYNGKRLLSRKTIELMLTNQVQPPLTNQMGLGFGLETLANDYQSIYSVGSFSWGGAFNTHYWADPKEKLVGLIFTNMYNSPVWSIGDKFKIATYQAIVD